MNRYDCIVVGMCLYGIYLVVQGILAALGVAVGLPFAQMDRLGMSDFRTGGFLQAIATSFLGSCLVLASLKLGSALTKNARHGETG